MKRACVVLILLIISFNAHALPSESSEPSIDLREIEHRFVELGVKQEALAIRDTGEWKKFWRRFVQESELPESKEIDFDRFDALIFLMGVKPSGGFGVKIERVEKAQRHIDADNIVQAIMCFPKGNEAQVSEVTAPYAVKVLKKRLGKYVWKIRKDVSGSQGCR